MLTGIIPWKKKVRAFYWFHELSQKASWMGSHAKPNFSANHGRSLRICYGSLYSIPRHSRTIQTALPWESSSCKSPTMKLEAALEENCVDEAWEVFDIYKRLHGFPKQVIVKKMIDLMTRSLGSRWLLRAYELVIALLCKSPHLLHHDCLVRLALVLARSQFPVPASTIIRIALDRFKYPSFEILSTFFFHMVKSDIGSCLACNILVEICASSLHHKPDARISKKFELLNRNVAIFNLVLNSCSNFGSLQKALLIIKFMSKMGLVADENSVVIFARIYENLGQRDELMRLKTHVDGVVSMTLSRHYRQFYNSLLNLLFKCNDLDAAMEVMLDLYSRSKSFQFGDDDSRALKCRPSKPYLLQIGSGNLTMGYQVTIDFNQLGSDFIVDSQGQSNLVIFSNRELVPSTKALAKLINGLAKEKRVTEVSKFLIGIENNIHSKERCFSTFVLAACIQLGWLETAHDVLDDLVSAGIFVEAHVYELLFKAYCKGNFFGESKVLLKQMQKLGLFVNLSYDDAVQLCLSRDCTIEPLEAESHFLDIKSCLVGHINREVEEGNLVCPLLYEFNSTILFFCEAGMMEDAIRTVKKMHEKGIHPTNQTFSYLLNGYSSLKMYRQITILWGEIKRRLEDGDLFVDRDLFECLLINFLKGGYFERVMEIADYMTRYKLFADKWKYKEEFLKNHRNLYRNLKTAHARTDAQRTRLEHVQAFRKWVHITKL